MSREQVNAFKKHRDAVDPQGDISWAARIEHKAMRASIQGMVHGDLELELELSEAERLLWRLLKIPRKYQDLELTAVLPVEMFRAFCRGLVAADVVDFVDSAQGKTPLPAEVKRIKAELAGVELPRTTSLKGRVFRPPIEGIGSFAPPSSSGWPAAHEVEPSSDAPSWMDSVERNSPEPVPLPQTGGPESPLDSEGRVLKEVVDRAFAAMSRQNHYEFMGIARGSDDGTVRTAYMKLAREYHPDRVASGAFANDPTIAPKVDALFKRLGDAHNLLARQESRATYDRMLDALGSRTESTSGKRQRRPIEAGNAFKMAETYFKKKEMKQAEAHYRQAAMFDPDDPKFLTGLAWCIYQNPDHEEVQRTTEARKRLSEAASTHRFADAAYKLGLLLRRANEEPAAQRQFALAHKYDSAHIDAAREVRLSDSRTKKIDNEKRANSGLFDRLGLNTKK